MLDREKERCGIYKVAESSCGWKINISLPPILIYAEWGKLKL
jgi:hypothetical protein